MNFIFVISIVNNLYEADAGLNFHWMTSSQGAIEKGFVYMQLKRKSTNNIQVV